MASVGSNHSNSRLLGSSHEGRKRCDDAEIEMRRPLQPHGRGENYENMDNFDDDPLHQYEDPLRFQGDPKKGPKLPARKERGTPRKKENDVYEPAKRRPRRYTDSSSEDSYYGPARRDPCWQCVRVMVFFIFFLALTALVLIAMIVLGFVPVKACDSSCSPVEVPDEQAATATGDGTFYRTIVELSERVKALEIDLEDKNDVINDLRARDAKQSDRIAELEAKLPLLRDYSGRAVTNVTAIVGPRGPRGFNGSRGPPGPRGPPGKANMSACYYKMEGSSPTTSGGGPSITVIEKAGERIMSVTCSTLGASEYNMESKISRDNTTRVYICHCKGTSTLFPESNGKAYCYIHYWVCPL